MYFISVGDSGLFHLSDGQMQTVNRPHIFANILDTAVSRGTLSKEQALLHPERESLTSFIGVGVLEEIDRNVDPWPISDGDTILLASDGLFKTLTADELLEACQGHPQTWPDSLVARTLAARLRISGQRDGAFGDGEGQAGHAEAPSACRGDRKNREQGENSPLSAWQTLAPDAGGRADRWNRRSGRGRRALVVQKTSSRTGHGEEMRHSREPAFKLGQATGGAGGFACRFRDCREGRWQARAACPTSYWHLRWALLIAGVAHAFGQSATDKMLQSSVVVFGTVEENGKAKPVSRGGGFMIDSRHVVTNLTACCGKTDKGETPQPVVVAGDKDASTAKVVWSNEETEIAILELKDPLERPALTIAPFKTVEKEQTVYTAQFPDPGESGTTPKISEGKILSLVKIENSATQVYKTSASMNKANSGGALFDACGNVIGINMMVKDGAQFAYVIDPLLDGLKAAGLTATLTQDHCGSAAAPASKSERCGAQERRGQLRRTPNGGGRRARSGFRWRCCSPRSPWRSARLGRKYRKRCCAIRRCRSRPNTCR